MLSRFARCKPSYVFYLILNLRKENVMDNTFITSDFKILFENRTSNFGFLKISLKNSDKILKSLLLKALYQAISRKSLLLKTKIDTRLKSKINLILIGALKNPFRINYFKPP